jgi:cobalamin biosynthesis Mg chelatase CobN
MAFQQTEWDSVLGIGKKAKARKVAKKATKQDFKLQKMAVRSQRRDNVLASKERRQQVKSDAEVKNVQAQANADQQVGVAQAGTQAVTNPQTSPPVAYEPSTPAGTGATMQIPGGGGGGGVDMSQPFQDIDAANKQQQDVQDGTDTTPQTEAPKPFDMKIILIIAVVVAAIYFLPKLLKKK